MNTNLKMIGLIALSALPLSASAQKMSQDKLPAAVRTAFEKAHPGVKATCEKEDGKYEVSFKEGAKEYTLSYDEAGALTETEQKMPVAELPAPVQATLKKDFAGYKLGDAEMSDKNGKTVYEVEAKQHRKEYELVFSPDGALVSKDAEKEEHEGKKHGHGGHGHKK